MDIDGNEIEIPTQLDPETKVITDRLDAMGIDEDGIQAHLDPEDIILIDRLFEDEKGELTKLADTIYLI